MKLLGPNMVDHKYYGNMTKFLADIIFLFNKKVEDVGEKAFYSGYNCCGYIKKVLKQKRSSMFREYGGRGTL